MTRQFAAGDQWKFGVGQYLSIVEGAKAPGDLVLRIATPQALVDPTRKLWRCEWENVSMATVLVAHAFLTENEDYVRPPAQGYMGGRYWKLAERNAEQDCAGALKNLRDQIRFARELERRRGE